MPENGHDPDLSPAELHERFAEECRQIDLAYAGGTLHDWIQEKLADERRNAGIPEQPAEP